MEKKRKNIFQIDDFSFSYEGADSKTLHHINCKMEEGEFYLVVGKSGSGKTTFLRQMKKELASAGKVQGSFTCNVDSQEVGFVLQNAANQIVTEYVMSELAFGLENHGVDRMTMRRRIGEITNFFGMESWMHKRTDELSGGQMQILNLAAIMVMNPKVVILDEPTTGLDPVGAENFLNVLRKIHEDIGTTIILAEQRLDLVTPLATQMITMEQGKIVCQGQVRDVIRWMFLCKNDLRASLPVPAQIAMGINPMEGKCPLTIREGKYWMQLHPPTKNENKKESNGEQIDSELALRAKHLYFRYGKKEMDVLQDLSFDMYQGRTNIILGNNGCGKSTLLELLAGEIKPLAGKIQVEGTTALLPQNPRFLFQKDRVEEETGLLEEFHLENVAKQHPYDLSGGESGRLGLAVIKETGADILLLDEPTRGMDIIFKMEFAEMIGQWTKAGKTIVIVTHDIEFAAKVGEYIYYLFDGNMAYSGGRDQFYRDNIFYTTAANRMLRDVAEVVTPEEAVELWED